MWGWGTPPAACMAPLPPWTMFVPPTYVHPIWAFSLLLIQRPHPRPYCSHTQCPACPVSSLLTEHPGYRAGRSGAAGAAPDGPPGEPGGAGPSPRTTEGYNNWTIAIVISMLSNSTWAGNLETPELFFPFYLILGVLSIHCPPYDWVQPRHTR